MTRDSRYEDERWAQFDQDILAGTYDCEPDWPPEPPPRPIRNVIHDIADYQPHTQEQPC